MVLGVCLSLLGSGRGLAVVSCMRACAAVSLGPPPQGHSSLTKAGSGEYDNTANTETEYQHSPAPLRSSSTMKDSSIFVRSKAASKPGSERLSACCCPPSLLPRTSTSRALQDWHLKLGSSIPAVVALCSQCQPVCQPFRLRPMLITPLPVKPPE